MSGNIFLKWCCCHDNSISPENVDESDDIYMICSRCVVVDVRSGECVVERLREVEDAYICLIHIPTIMPYEWCVRATRGSLPFILFTCVIYFAISCLLKKNVFNEFDIWLDALVSIYSWKL